jgi:hypothetical protein
MLAEATMDVMERETGLPKADRKLGILATVTVPGLVVSAHGFERRRREAGVGSGRVAPMRPSVRPRRADASRALERLAAAPPPQGVRKSEGPDPDGSVPAIVERDVRRQRAGRVRHVVVAQQQHRRSGHRSGEVARPADRLVLAARDPHGEGEFEVAQARARAPDVVGGLVQPEAPFEPGRS